MRFIDWSSIFSLLVSTVALFSCQYRGTPADGTQKCADGPKPCPDGYLCSQGYCYSGATADIPASGLAGIVIDDANNPLAGAVVAAYGATVTTTSDGHFLLSSVTLPADRATIAAQKTGYFDTTTSVVPNPSGQTNVTLMLVKQILMGTVDNNSGGTVADPGGNVSATFAPESFVGADGSRITEPVQVYGAYFNPDSPDFPRQMPGGDFRATDTSGTEGSLVSYGAAAVEARTNSGKTVQLSSSTGKSSDGQSGCITIPASMRADAPDTMPVWILGAVTNKWTTMSTATKNGNQYCFSVSALGKINCDIFSRFASLKGRVCKDGKPLSDVSVTINQMTVQTGSDGYYRAIVSSGQTLNIKSQYGNTTASPLQPDASVCAPDIGTCSGSGCGTNSSPDAGVARKDAGADTAPKSQWGCNTTTTKTQGGAVNSCSCAFIPPDPQLPDSNCGTVTECCYTMQSSEVPICNCVSGLGAGILTASDCSNAASVVGGTVAAKCPP
jgi:hypothetical protein